MTCRVRMPPRRGLVPAARRRRPARRPALPAAGCGSADVLGGGDQMGDEIERAVTAAGPARATIGRSAPPAPAQRRRALRPSRRRHLPSALVDRCLTSQIEIRLNCHVLGRCAPYDFILARAMPVLAALFPATAKRGFRNIYELCLRFPAGNRHYPEGRESPGSVLKRGDRDIRSSESFDHPGFARPGGLRLGHRHRRDHLERPCRARCFRIFRRTRWQAARSFPS